MRPSSIILSAVLVAVLVLVAMPGRAPVLQVAEATHLGAAECPLGPEPVHDGVIEPGEYFESIFDSSTKSVVYLRCGQDAERFMHIAIVTSWEDWIEVRLQATDVWNGDLNVIRVSPAEPAPHVLDGFVGDGLATFVSDVVLGGSFDVLEPVSRKVGDYVVHEFAVPLHSDDPYDSQLSGEEPIYLQLAWLSQEEDESYSVVLESDPFFVGLEATYQEGLWTFIDLSIPSEARPDERLDVLLSLRDGNGTPLPLQKVSVFLRTTFGFLDLGEVVTNEQGLAWISYSALGSGEYLLGAAFPGGGGLLASVSWLKFRVVPLPSPPTYVPRVLLMVQSLALLVVGGVWTTFAYVIFIVRRSMGSSGQERGAIGERAQTHGG